MSPRLRIASISMASAIAIGLCVAIGVAPPAAAEPCQGGAAAAQPPATQAETPDLPSSSNRRPTGQRPSGANESAPLPKLGPITSAVVNALLHAPRKSSSKPPWRLPPHPPTLPPNNPRAAAQRRPGTGAAPAPPSPPGTSLVGWVTGPDSPNKTIEKFAITGTDLGIMWDNGDPAKC